MGSRFEGVRDEEGDARVWAVAAVPASTPLHFVKFFVVLNQFQFIFFSQMLRELACWCDDDCDSSALLQVALPAKNKTFNPLQQSRLLAVEAVPRMTR
jgi:hypothetical protein